MAEKTPIEISNLTSISTRYEGFLFDAYGVLMDGSGLIVAAAAAWHELRKQGKSCWILTNGSARTLPEAVKAYQTLGLDVCLDEVISSGSLLFRFFQERGLQGAPTCVLGTESSRTLVREAGGVPINVLQNQDFEVLVLANQSEYPLLETLDAVLTQVCRRIEQFLPCCLILTNPDLIYPKSGQNFGFTAGALAIMIEAGLKLRLGLDAPEFERLGKPFTPIFAEAERRAGHKNLLMIGDQLETDILGAQRYGIDSVLVGTGLTRLNRMPAAAPEATYLLRDWRP